jgi:hypothetical protein
MAEPWKKFQAVKKPWEKYSQPEPRAVLGGDKVAPFGLTGPVTGQADQAAQDRADFAAMPWYQQGPRAVGDMLTIGAENVPFALQAGYQLDKFTKGQDVADKNWEQTQGQIQSARNRAGFAGVGLDVAALSKLGIKAAQHGITATPKLGSFLGGLVDNAALGAVDAASRDQNVLTGAGLAAAGGVLASTIGKGINYIHNKKLPLAEKLQKQAAEKIQGLIAGMKGAPNAVNQSIDDLGPDAMLIDALGEKGASLGRWAANISPDARETLSAALQGRAQGQNKRVVDTLLKEAGLDPSDIKSVSSYGREVYENSQPAISAAYATAKANGAKLPLKQFKDVLLTPQGRAAYLEGVKSAKTAKVLRGDPARGLNRLEVLDLAKRSLDDKASSAFRQGENFAGSQSAGLAKMLREKVDEFVPEYGGARALRAKLGQREDAIKMGADLAQGRVTVDKLKSGAKTAPETYDDLAKGYALQQSENFLNKQNTAGALGSLSTPGGKTAVDVVYGSKAAPIASRLSAEKTFNKSMSAINGNSTTARQIADMLAGGGIGLGGALATGQDLMTGGISGLALGAARRSIPVLTQKLATKRSREIAPYIAEMLTKGVIPKAAKNKLSNEALKALQLTSAILASRAGASE